MDACCKTTLWNNGNGGKTVKRGIEKINSVKEKKPFDDYLVSTSAKRSNVHDNTTIVNEPSDFNPTMD